MVENYEEHDGNPVENEQDVDENEEKQEDKKEVEKENKEFVEPEKLPIDEQNHTSLVTGEPKNEDNSIRSFFKAVTPKSVVVLPLFKRPAFPGTLFPLTLSISQGWLSQMMKKNRFPMFGLFYAKPQKVNPENGEEDNEEREITNVNDLYEVGVLARVAEYSPTKDGAFVVLGCIRRIRITGQVETKSDTAQLSPAPHGKRSRIGMIARIEEFEDKNVSRKTDPQLQALILETMRSLQELSKSQTFYKEQLRLFMEQVDIQNPVELADVAAIILGANGDKLQEILQSSDIKERLAKTLLLLKQEIETVKIQEKIQKQLEQKVNDSQRKYYLHEQLKILKKELGLETDERSAIAQKYKDRLVDKVVPEKVQKVIDEEMQKLQTLEISSSEFTVCRNYLDWLTCLPWGIYKPDSFDLKKSKEILDKDHYGLNKVKERILEFLAVGKMKGNVQGKIICFVGPPGTGKTSIGKSIAEALDREYLHFSVGGVTDVTEIKGHRRTYIGAMPGKIIQLLKQAKTANPIILIDEIDKMGRYLGDPAAALLEVLDPVQNQTFVDHYLDVPIDLSKVLFICTANVLDTISGPLLDRMEIIRLSGYIEEEKTAIAQQYLIPKGMEEHGLKKEHITFMKSGLIHLIRYYCRESGVRNLKKQIDTLLRKAAYNYVTKNKKTVIRESTVKKLLGPPPFTDDRYFHNPPIGICMGLAWTSMGGSTLYIETLAEKGKSGLQLTGKLGEVMKESSSIAYSYAKNFYLKHFPDGKFFETHSIHLHVPEGATPKDGPSAGVTMVTALLSLAFGIPVRSDIAMTGELTLTGKVLEIGGVKEKTIAAKRSGITNILLPKNNEKDWLELDEHIKKGVSVTFADRYDDVFLFAFQQIAKEENKEWTPQEKEAFEKAYGLYGDYDESEKWDLISEYIGTKDNISCKSFASQLLGTNDLHVTPRLAPKEILKIRGFSFKSEPIVQDKKQIEEQV